MGTRISLSIIIPVYKVEPYLRECLDSIAVSQLDCWEAILIDDGSPDGCPQICDEYVARDSRFCVIHQENAGVAAARNAGLDVARGEWCWFVDSDDIVDMRPVGEMVVWLKEHQNVDLVMFDLETFYKNGDVKLNDNKKLSITDEHLSKNDFLMKHICYHHQRLWYHRRGWCNNHQPSAQHDGMRFTRGIRLAEDLEFQYKYLTLCQHPAKVNNVLYYYRVREGSATQNDTYRMKAVEDLQIVLSNLADWIRNIGIKSEPWLDFRIMKLFQNLLYSASLVRNLDTKNFQMLVRTIMAEYRSVHFSFVQKIKYRVADADIKLYFLLNRIYLKIRVLNTCSW